MIKDQYKLSCFFDIVNMLTLPEPLIVSCYMNRNSQSNKLLLFLITL